MAAAKKGQPPELWKGINLKAENAAQKCACQYHKKRGKEPGCDLFIDPLLPHLPVVINTQGTNNT